MAAFLLKYITGFEVSFFTSTGHWEGVLTSILIPLINGVEISFQVSPTVTAKEVGSKKIENKKRKRLELGN